MEERLWSRPGDEAGAYWLADNHGRALTVYGLNAILRDYARFSGLPGCQLPVSTASLRK